MTTNSTTNRATAGKPGVDPKILLYGIIAILISGVGYLLYRNVRLHKAFDEERAHTRQTVRQNQLANDRQQLTFGMKTFVWAVRNAMLQNKPGEIDEYFNTLVRDRGIKEVLLVNPTGKVVLSTNKKNQGIDFDSRFPIYLRAQKGVHFSDKRPYELSAPVMAPNQRLGTLVMFYTPAPVLPDSTSR